jgi:5'-nucleotidase
MIVALPLQMIYAQQKVELNILHTSDTHSRIEPIDPNSHDKNAGRGGCVRRATIVSEARAADADLLLLDCGDFSQGTPYYNWFKGELEIKVMNLLKYDACTIGNHEFDFGLDNMARLFRMADFPVVCANYDVSATVLRDLVKPYTILKKKGLTIGVFGLSPELKGLVQADKCEGIVYKEPLEVANEMARILKEEKGCDAVICLSHLGQEVDHQLIPQTRNIDLVLGGHSHTFMDNEEQIVNADGRNVALIHTGKNGVNVGELKMTLEARK